MTTHTRPQVYNMGRLLHSAAKAVDKAAREHIEVEHVSISAVLGVRLHPTDRELTAALALALGMRDRHIMLSHDGRAVEFFAGEFDGVDFTTHADVPDGVRLWTYRYYSDSEPRDHAGFDSGAGFLSHDAAVSAARDSLGKGEWGQSGGNEYTYRDRYGRTGYVYVQAVAR